MRPVCKYTVACAYLSQTLNLPVHQHLHVTESSFVSVPRRCNIEGEDGWSWGRTMRVKETGREPRAGLDTQQCMSFAP